MSHEGWDLLIKSAAVVIPIFMTIIFSLIAFGLTQTIGRVNDKVHAVSTALTEHKDECSKVDKAVLAEKVETHEREIAAFRKFAHWVGDCVGRIAGKLNVELPNRPQ